MIPPIDSDWETIAAYALTFNGYKFAGGGPLELSYLCDLVSLDPENATVEQLRACLFFIQRSGRFCGDEGNDYDLAEARGILELLHKKSQP
jgi:hypothetical protein